MRQCSLLVLVISMVGCNSGLSEFPTAKVSGQVLCDGKPVPNVRVVFGPVAMNSKSESGKSAFGQADAEGKFELSTYGDKDGSVVGKSKVVVIAPHPEDFKDFKCDCETDGRKAVQEVEVAASGENNFTINLPPKTKTSRPNVSRKDIEDITGVSEKDQKKQEQQEAAARR